MQQQKQKKIPVRRCVGCNAQRPKRELVRVVRSPEGEISIDLRGKAPGRGAYLCPSAACLAKARKAKRLERTFEVPIPDGIYDRLTALTTMPAAVHRPRCTASWSTLLSCWPPS